MNAITTAQPYITTNWHPRAIARWGLCVLLVVIGLYMYTLISTTMMVAEKRALETDMKQLASHLSDAEVRYMNIAESWSSEAIAEEGFRVASNVYFVNEGAAHTNVAYATR